MKPLFAIALLAVSPGFAQKFGPENLAPYIPTPQTIVETMLDAAQVKPTDVVYDLGSGDGRIVIMAAQKYGARGVGVEMVPQLCQTARRNIRLAGVEDRVTIIQGSALRVDLSPADVVTMVFLTTSNERLKPLLQRYLKPGARVVSSEFPIKGWRPAETVRVAQGSLEHKIYVYEMGREQ